MKTNLINGALLSRANVGSRISKRVVGMGMFLIGLLVSCRAVSAGRAEIHSEWIGHSAGALDGTLQRRCQSLRSGVRA